MKKLRKLVLSRETLMTLDAHEVGDVHGGVTPAMASFQASAAASAKHSEATRAKLVRFVDTVKKGIASKNW